MFKRKTRELNAELNLALAQVFGLSSNGVLNEQDAKKLIHDKLMEHCII